MNRLIAITGGSGAGKTTIARALERRLAPEALVIGEDDFYRCTSTVPNFDAATYNFDEPAAKDEAAFFECLSRARRGEAFEKPIYNMATHRRETRTERVAPPAYVILEGIHILAMPSLRPLFDLSVYIDCAEALRLGRRMIRDVEERGRTARSVFDQFFQTVRPMHEMHVESQRALADLVLTSTYTGGMAEAEALADAIVARLKALKR